VRQQWANWKAGRQRVGKSQRQQPLGMLIGSMQENPNIIPQNNPPIGGWGDLTGISTSSVVFAQFIVMAVTTTETHKPCYVNCINGLRQCSACDVA